jgi:hypothetical protein
LQTVGKNAQFTIITSGDTIILKKVTPARLSEIAERTPQDKPAEQPSRKLFRATTIVALFNNCL